MLLNHQATMNKKKAQTQNLIVLGVQAADLNTLRERAKRFEWLVN